MADEPTTTEDSDQGPIEKAFDFRPSLEELARQGKPQTLPEVLRNAGRSLPDEMRQYLVSVAGASVLESSTLGCLIEAGKLPPTAVDVLRSGQVLCQSGRPAKEWASTLEGVRAARCIVEDQRDVVAKLSGEPPDRSEPMPSFRLVEKQLTAVEESVRKAECFLKDNEYGWDWKRGVLTAKGRGRPGQAGPLLRPFVEALLLAFLATENTPEVREKIASELAPLFASELLNTSKGSPLYNAVDRLMNPR